MLSNSNQWTTVTISYNMILYQSLLSVVCSCICIWDLWVSHSVESPAIDLTHRCMYYALIHYLHTVFRLSSWYYVAYSSVTCHAAWFSDGTICSTSNACILHNIIWWCLSDMCLSYCLVDYEIWLYRMSYFQRFLNDK